MAVPYMLMYDIPSCVKLTNPTWWLLPIAVRINKSVWVIQENTLPPVRLREWERNGVKWYTLPFDTKAMGDITKLVVECLTNDIRLTVERSQASCDASMRTLLRSKQPAAKAAKQMRSKVNATIKKMGAKLNAIRSAARRFAVEPGRIGYAQAAVSAEELKGVILHRAEVMMKAAAEIERSEPNSPMAKAARNGRVPGDILADYLQDRGKDETAGNLRKLFME